MAYNDDAQVFERQIVIENISQQAGVTSGSIVNKGTLSTLDTYISGHTVVNNVKITPNLNDIIFEQQASLANNQASFTNIEDFFFDDSVATSFKAIINVTVSAGQAKHAVWEINGLYKPTGWVITSSFTGDLTGVQFSIDNQAGGIGQVQYKNSNTSGTTIIRYRATTTAPPGSTPIGMSGGVISNTSGPFLANNLIYANTTDTLASTDITYNSNVLSIGGTSRLVAEKATNFVNFSNGGSITSMGDASIAKRVIVGEKVGIATTAPGYALDVVGDINFTGTFYKNNNIYSGSEIWGTNGTKVFYTTGNVGFGTTNPSHQLDVSGDARITSSLSAGSVNTVNATATHVSTGTLQAPNGITAGNINFTGSLYQNGLPYLGSQWTTTAGNVSYTSGSVDARDINATNLNVTNSTFGGHMIPSSTLTYDLGSANNRWRTLYLSGNTIDLGGTLISASTTGSITFGETVISTTTSGNVVSSFKNATIDTLSSTSGNFVTLTAGTLNAANIKSTTITVGTLLANTITGANLSLSGDLVVGGTLTTVNITTTNVVDTNISTGTLSVGSTLNVSGLSALANVTATNVSTGGLNASGLSDLANATATNVSTGGLNASGLSALANATVTNVSTGTISASGLSALANATVTNVSTGGLNASGLSALANATATHVSTGTLQAPDGITAGNINFTGSLYQNGLPYLGSQWTTTAGNVSYTSGSVDASTLIATNISTGGLNASGLSALANATATNVSTGGLNASGLSAVANVTATNVSAGVLIASTGLTTGTINASGLSALANATATNVSTGGLNASGLSALANATATNVSTGGLNASGLSAVANITATNVSAGVLIASTGLTTGTINLTSTKIALGSNAGNTSQGTNTVAIGNAAGYSSQGNSSVALGANSAFTSQGANSVAIGNAAGQTSQSATAVAIGNSAAQNYQGFGGVAMGYQAGQTSQGSYAIAMGYMAGQTSQHQNSIILNANNVALNSGTTGAFYVSSVRNVTQTNILAYDTTAKEVTYFSLSNITTSNLVATNVSTGVLIASTGVTTGTISASGLSALANVTATNVSAGVLIASTSVSSAMLSATNATVTNIVATALTAGSIKTSDIALNGNLIATGDITAFGSLSDRRLKTNIINIDSESALNTVRSLRPVTFDWRDDIFNESKRGTHDVGFIAQEVEEVVPQAVAEYQEMNSGSVYKNIKHERLLPYLVGAIQKLEYVIEQQQLKIEQLEQKFQ